MGLRNSDRDKFSQLFDKYDADHDYDPNYEFCTGDEVSLLTDCITRGVIFDAYKNSSMHSIGKVLAIQDSVFLMENELNYSDLIAGRYKSDIQPDKSSLEALIHSAANHTAESQLTDKGPAKEYIFER